MSLENWLLNIRTPIFTTISLCAFEKFQQLLLVQGIEGFISYCQLHSKLDLMAYILSVCDIIDCSFFSKILSFLHLLILLIQGPEIALHCELFWGFSITEVIYQYSYIHIYRAVFFVSLLNIYTYLCSYTIYITIEIYFSICV
jgi:hypothetical protein